MPAKTLAHHPVPAVVAAGCDDATFEAIQQGIRGKVPGRLTKSSLSGLATTVASTRPFAILLSEDAYDLDSKEFDDLARDVNATLLTFPNRSEANDWIQEKLVPDLDAAFLKYAKST